MGRCTNGEAQNYSRVEKETENSTFSAEDPLPGFEPRTMRMKPKPEVHSRQCWTCVYLSTLLSEKMQYHQPGVAKRFDPRAKFATAWPDKVRFT